MKIYFVQSNQLSPYKNIAVERYLTRHVKPNSVIMYLWQNQKTVVIGKNQNYIAECNIEKLYDDGGFLARRFSGGGAVYHDTGNLNFSFIASKDLHNVDRQLSVILQAVNSYTLINKAEKSGRNDITINGAKFSGNAFFTTENCCHHGTILVDVDFSKLANYLQVNQKKLASKGVDSVKSRVINLNTLADITVENLSEKLKEAFCAEYKSKFEVIDFNSLQNAEISELTSLLSSRNWLYNDCRTFKHSIERKFDWGLVSIGFETNNGIITAMQVFTDALDDKMAKIIETAFIGLSLEKLKSLQLTNELLDVKELILTQNS